MAAVTICSDFGAEKDKTDKTLTRRTKNKREKAQIKIGNEREVTMDTTEAQKIVREFCEQLYHFMGNRWGNSGNSVRLYFLGLQNHCRW